MGGGIITFQDAADNGACIDGVLEFCRDRLGGRLSVAIATAMRVANKSEARYIGDGYGYGYGGDGGYGYGYGGNGYGHGYGGNGDGYGGYG